MVIATGERQMNTSGCAGAEKLPDTESMLTSFMGTVGSMRSGRRQTRYSGARQVPIYPNSHVSSLSGNNTY